MQFRSLNGGLQPLLLWKGCPHTCTEASPREIHAPPKLFRRLLKILRATNRTSNTYNTEYLQIQPLFEYEHRRPKAEQFHQLSNAILISAQITRKFRENRKNTNRSTPIFIQKNNLKQKMQFSIRHLQQKL